MFRGHFSFSGVELCAQRCEPDPLRLQGKSNEQHCDIRDFYGCKDDDVLGFGAA